jgi:hypothetical protein
MIDSECNIKYNKMEKDKKKSKKAPKEEPVEEEEVQE